MELSRNQAQENQINYNRVQESKKKKKKNASILVSTASFCGFAIENGQSNLCSFGSPLLDGYARLGASPSKIILDVSIMSHGAASLWNH